jgi:predicted ATPase/serine/threonine protein kinase
MTPERHRRLRELFLEAIARPPEARAAYLDAACASDAELRARVEGLLARHSDESSDAPGLAPAGAEAGLLGTGTIVARRYRIEGRLGAGGMGTIYRAFQLGLERTVALKVIRGELLDKPKVLRRFKREAMAVARLRHPNVVTVYDYDVDAGVGAYLVMEMLTGRSLREEIAERGRLPVGEALALMKQVCAGVGAAHGARVTHRDLKPANIFLERGAGDTTIAKVLDFGLARVEEAFVSQALTPRGAVMGTPHYMSPEQCRGEEADARSDVYALGCVLYEMLTGRPPFDGAHVATLVYQHVAKEPRPPSELAPGVTPALETAVLRALAKAPEDRYRTATDFGKALGGPPPSVSLAPPAGPPSTDSASERRTPSNLPHATTHFVRHGRQVEDVGEWLSKSRLVTLTGPGGIGKTRLALEATADVAGRYDDGVRLVQLATLTRGTILEEAVAAALGARAEPARPMPQTLAEWIGERDMLLVLDNCEHLVDECARLAETLLRDCRTLRVLATSREPLGVAGERVLPVPPLPVPDPADPAIAERLSEYGATALFLDRARRSKPAFAASPHDARAVAEICRRLDGIPLAIELAAARVKALTVGQILARLDDRFRLLVGGSRTAPSRQQTLRAALDWSYELLTEEEGALVRRLSVFAGGWTLEAAEAACGNDALQHLERLVDKSLVLVHDAGREVRYGMLETIREYARERSEGGEADDAGRRHADFFLALAETSAPGTLVTREAERVERLAAEHDNLRAALGWLLEHDAEGCLRLTSALRVLWSLHGHLREGRRWLETALERSPTASADLRLAALRANADLARQQGDLDAALACYEAAVRLATEAGDETNIVVLSTELGQLSLQRGDLETARALFEKCRAIAGAAGAEFLVPIALNSLGEIARVEGAWAEARRFYEEAEALARQAGDRYGVTVALANLGALAYERGDPRAASASYREALAAARALGDTVGVSLSLDGLGAVAERRGDWERAARLAGAAEAMRATIGYELEHTDRAFRDNYLSVVRERLGETALEAALAEGRAMTLEQAARTASEEPEA